MISNVDGVQILTWSWVGAEQIGSLYAIIGRATNTLEPQLWPKWLAEMERQASSSLGLSGTGKRKPYVSVRSDYLIAAAQALRYKAHSDAGHSQGAESFRKEDTYEWEAANAIDLALDEAKVRR